MTKMTEPNPCTRVYPDASRASLAAADELAELLVSPRTRTLVVAGGNTPLELYGLLAQRRLALDHLNVFTLDEYVGVPRDDSRTCENLLSRTVAEAWGIDTNRFHGISSLEDQALQSILEHERKLEAFGGIDVVVLGLGKNGHLGFNEPGSSPESPCRLLDLESTSVKANSIWFNGEYAPDRGVTLGLSNLLRAKTVFVLAFGDAKTDAVCNMLLGPSNDWCPASWLQQHTDARFFLDRQAAASLPRKSYTSTES